MIDISRDGIIKLLATNDKAVCRALVVLYNNQTADEQESETTHHHNGMGFSGFDAEIGTKMAKFYLDNNFLTPKQIAVWRKLNRNGLMRISRYWRQLVEAAQQKQKQDISFNYGQNSQYQ